VPSDFEYAEDADHLAAHGVTLEEAAECFYNEHPVQVPAKHWARRVPVRRLDLAAKFHVLSILYSLGAEATVSVGAQKDVDITVVRKPGEVVTIDVKAVRQPMSELAVAQHAVDEVGGRAVEDDDLDGAAQRQLELALQAEALEARRRRVAEEDAQVDIAPRPGGAARLAAEEVGRHHLLAGCLQQAPQALDEINVGHPAPV
jgi:hypothetical protein